MLLELAASLPLPRTIPTDLKLIAYKGEDDFDRLWGDLGPAFGYHERNISTYEQNKVYM
jgi:hypothetical protein